MLQELVEFSARCTDRNGIVVPLPNLVARMQGLAFDLAGFVLHAIGLEQPFSTDNYRSMRVDAVCRCNAFDELGITPAVIESIVPAYLADR